VAVLVVILLDDATQAQSMGRWKVWLGGGRANATLYSLNTLTTGTRTIDYRPVLIVSCDPRRYPVWRQELLVRRIISGQDRIDVTMRFDNASPFVEQWTLSDMNRSLRSDGGEAVARLARSRRFHAAWRFGVFSGGGEAIFDVAGIRDTLVELGRACGTDVP
jgi:hypothetical protein